MERAGEIDESALARRILDASLALIDEGGLASLSMREVARRAGVSHQAPYHHFADRESILAAIARDGFTMLDAKLTAALATAPSLRDRIVAMGCGYVRFAVAHPAHFRVMFRPDLVDLQRFPEAMCCGDLAFRHVKSVVHELLGTSPEAPTPEDDVWASILWSSGHGLACLILDGPLALKIASSEARDAHIDSVFATMTDAMIARASAAPDLRPHAPGQSAATPPARETKKRNEVKHEASKRGARAAALPARPASLPPLVVAARKVRLKGLTIMRPSASLALALTLVAATVAAACGPAKAPEEPTTEPAPVATPDAPKPDAPPPAASSATGPATPPPGPSGGRAVTPSQMGDKLAALGLDPKALPAFDKLTPDQKRKVMPLFKQSLGYAECTGCHAEGDFKKVTKHMKIAEGMWDHFASQLKQDGGGLLFCDSCHGGSEHILAKDPEAVRKFMHDEYVDKLDRADGKGHDCKTCHGDKLELDIFGKLWHAE